MTKKKAVSPFDFLNTINFTKSDLMLDPDNESKYAAYIVNRSLSYFPDTIAIANEMNRYHHLDGKLQYHFLLNLVRKRKRFSKWIKPDVNNDVQVVKDYYRYSDNKARQVLSLLSEDQLIILRKKVSVGGKKV